MPQIKPTTLRQAIERYLTYLQSEENKAPLTIDSYRSSLEFIDGLLQVNDPWNIDKATVRRLKQRLHVYRTSRGAELSVRTKNHHLSALRAFLRYLLQEEELDVYPPDRIRRLREEPRKVKVLSIGQLDRLLSAPDLSTRAGKPGKLIVAKQSTLRVTASTRLVYSCVRGSNVDPMYFSL